MTQRTPAAILEAHQFVLIDLPHENPPQAYHREFPVPSHGFAQISIKREFSPVQAVEIEVRVLGLSDSGELCRYLRRTDDSQSIEQLESAVFTEIMNLKVGFTTLATLCGITL
jgi:hypothetical protein